MKTTSTFIILILFFLTANSQTAEVFEENGKFGAKHSGDEVISAEYDAVKVLEGCDHVYFGTQKNGKWAIWVLGKRITEYIYDDLKKFADDTGIKSYDGDLGFILAAKFGKWGLLAANDCNTAREVIPHKYESFEYFLSPEFEAPYLIIAKRQNLLDFYVYTGGYNGYNPINGLDNVTGYEFVEIEDYDSPFLILAKQRGKLNVFKNMDFADYQAVGHLQGIEDLDMVVQNYDYKYAYFKTRSGWGLTDFFHEIIEPVYLDIEMLFIEDYEYQEPAGTAIVTTKHGKNIVRFDFSGKEMLSTYVQDIIIPPINNESPEMGMALKINDKWYAYGDEPYLGAKETDNFEPSAMYGKLGFDSIIWVNEEEYWAKHDNMWALGSIYSLEFNSLFDYKKPKKNGLKGFHWLPKDFLDNPKKFGKITRVGDEDSENERYIFKKNGKYGFFENDFIFPPMFDSVVALPKLGFAVYLDRKVGIMHMTNQSKIIYDSYSKAKGNNYIYLLHKADKVVPVCLTFDFFFDQEFDSIKVQTNPYAIIGSLNGKIGGFSDPEFCIRPHFDDIIFLENKTKHAFCKEGERYKLVSGLYNITEEYYDKFEYCEADKNVLYLQSMGEWSVWDYTKPARFAPDSNLSMLKKRTIDRFDDYIKEQMANNVVITKMDKNLYQMNSDNGKEIVYMSKSDAARQQVWKKHFMTEPVEDILGTFTDESFVIKNNGKSGLFVPNGKNSYISPIDFKYILYDSSNMSLNILVKPNGKKAIYYKRPYPSADMNDSTLFDEVHIIQETPLVYKLKRDDKYGMFYQPKEKADFIYIPCKYEDIAFVKRLKKKKYSDFYAFKKDGKWGIMYYSSPTYEYEKVPPKYSSVKKAVKKIK